ncbi:MAG: CBS domain-containing protein [Candidatus Aenigmatarchaeota archaeon]
MVLKLLKDKFRRNREPLDERMIEGKKILIQKLVDEKSKKVPIVIKTTVKDIMSTDLKTLDPDDNIGYALELFSEYAITGAPVVKNGKVFGILSQTDIIKLMYEKKLFDSKSDEIDINELQKIKVKDFMSKNVYFIDQDEKLTDASKLMAEKKVHRLLVRDGKKNLVGIITMEDVVMGLSAEFFVDSIHRATDKVIQSEIDYLLEIVEKRRQVTVDQIAKEMNLKENHIENLAKILEKKGLIKIEYGMFGSPILKVKE